jgi:hypothetical protein
LDAVIDIVATDRTIPSNATIAPKTRDQIQTYTIIEAWGGKAIVDVRAAVLTLKPIDADARIFE